MTPAFLLSGEDGIATDDERSAMFARVDDVQEIDARSCPTRRRTSPRVLNQFTRSTRSSFDASTESDCLLNTCELALLSQSDCLFLNSIFRSILAVD